MFFFDKNVFFEKHNFIHKKVLIIRIQIHLLAVQEVHDGLQDIVSLLDYAAIGWHSLPFDLGEDVSHLSHVVLDLGLETGSHTQKRTE